MSALTGNPHHAAANYVELDGAPYAIAQATLALAYEQRTANLIAFYGHGQFLGSDEVFRQIIERLGIK